jgi:hypothetical protein
MLVFTFCAICLFDRVTLWLLIALCVYTYIDWVAVSLCINRNPQEFSGSKRRQAKRRSRRHTGSLQSSTIRTKTLGCVRHHLSRTTERSALYTPSMLVVTTAGAVVLYNRCSACVHDTLSFSHCTR